MRFSAVAAAFVGFGCFSPDIPSGAFRCAADEPRCPEGQSCSDGGTCTVPMEIVADGGQMFADAMTGSDKGAIDLNGVPRPPGVVCDDDDLEENGSFMDATELIAGTHPDLEVCWPGDVDFYKVAVEVGQSVHITVDFAHSLGDLDASAQDSQGRFIEGIDAQSVTDDESVEFVAKEAGSYRIAVAGYLKATNSYLLVIDIE